MNGCGSISNISTDGPSCSTLKSFCAPWKQSSQGQVSRASYSTSHSLSGAKSTMRVLVTGGAGFIGGHLVDRFHQEGFEVRVLDILDPKVHPTGQPPRFPAGVEFIRGDVTDRETLRYALRNVDVVSHQAAYQDYMPDFSRFLSVNAVGTALLYELIVEDRMKIRKVIVASSQAVYGEGQYRCEEHGAFLPIPRSAGQLKGREWGA